MHDGDFRDRYNTERRHASLQSDLALPMNQLITLGADFLDDSIESTADFSSDSRDNGGVFGLYQIGIGSHRISASARHDDNQQFGSRNTNNAGWKWQIIPSIHVMAGWGTAFRAPSFNDLYSPFGGNPICARSSESYNGSAATWKLWRERQRNKRIRRVMNSKIGERSTPQGKIEALKSKRCNGVETPSRKLRYVVHATKMPDKLRQILQRGRIARVTIAHSWQE